MKFRDRWEAGVKLGDALARDKFENPVVLGLPRGGVVPAAAVARSLRAPLDIVVARKIGHPWAHEYAIGAIAETGAPVWNRTELALSREAAQTERAAALQLEAVELRAFYASGREPMTLWGRTAVLVDDGIATGLTMAAAAGEVRRRGAAKVVVAVPVAPLSARRDLTGYADEIFILVEPAAGFQSVGQFYEHFDQVDSSAVRRILSGHQPPDQTALNLPALEQVVGAVERYPVTSGTLANKAREHNAPASVVQFFESIPRDITFSSAGDVLTRTTEASLLMDQELTEPPEDVYPGD
jgi:putative phosphoribosyl transferase